MYDELYIRTTYDERDLRSVLEIYTYDDDGEEEVCEDATDACIELTTCADQGKDTWSWLLNAVKRNLKANGIKYNSVEFDPDEPVM